MEFLDNTIGKKVLIPVIGLVVLLLAGLGLLMGQNNYASLKSAIESKGNGLSSLLAKISVTYIESYDFNSLSVFIDELSKDPDVIFANFYDAEGELISESSQEPDDVTNLFIYEREIKSEEDEILGRLKMGFSKKALDESLETNILIVGVGVGLVIVLLSLGATFIVNLAVIKPVTKLRGDAAQLASGHLDHQIDTSSRDELGSLAQSFSEMRDSIRNTIEDLHKLNDVGKVLAGMFDQTKALETVLQVMKEKSQVEWGSVYLVNDQGELDVQAYYPPRELGVDHTSRSFKLGEGVAGKAAAEQRIVYIPDTSTTEGFVPSTHDKPKSLLSIPLVDGNKSFGVINLSGPVNQVKYLESDEEFVETLAGMTVVTTKNIQMVKVIEEHSRTLELKVQERTAAIKDLMDNTGQGFFSFGNDYVVRPEYSKPCQVFFDGPIENLNALALMFGNSDLSAVDFREHFDKGNLEAFIQHPDSVQEVLDMVFNGVGDLEILGEMLPKEISRLGKVLSLEYRHLKSDDEKFMMILTDITKERELADQIAEEEERNTMILKVALDRDGFLQFLRELERLFSSIFVALDRSPEEIDPNEMFRYFHTIKGGTASYGLKKVAEATHEIEGRLENFRSGQDQLNHELTSQLKENTENLRKIFDRTLAELSSIISTEDLQETDRTYKIRDSKLNELKDFLLHKMPQDTLNEVKGAIDDLRKQPIGPMLLKYAAAAEGLAEKLNKPVNVEVHGKNVEVSYEQLEGVFGSLVHLVRNCVDHGLEETEMRPMLDKPEEGTIIIKAIAKEHTLKIMIADDGGGIDPDVIKNIALKKGIITEDDAESASDNELVKLIFAPGFSTKEEVTDVSGRGVGMDAVKSTVDELGGQIQIETELDKGTTFEIQIPHAA